MAIDQKYGQVEIPGVPWDEPVFILRAQDKFAPGAIADYGSRYVRLSGLLKETPNPEFRAGVDQVVDGFLEWQAGNADKVKIPD